MSESFVLSHFFSCFPSVFGQKGLSTLQVINIYKNSFSLLPLSKILLSFLMTTLPCDLPEETSLLPKSLKVSFYAFLSSTLSRIRRRWSLILSVILWKLFSKEFTSVPFFRVCKKTDHIPINTWQPLNNFFDYTY